MRKLYIVFITIILLIIGFHVGRYIYKISVIDTELLASVEKQLGDIQQEYSTRYKTAVASTSTSEKLSPNATLIFKTEYEKCGHTLNEYKKATTSEVNMTRSELQSKYPEWEITEFSEQEVILWQKDDSSCQQHFIIRESNGNIAVYLIKENNTEQLQQLTNISTRYLTQVDLEKLRDGIRVNGVEELNSKLEDFE